VVGSGAAAGGPLSVSVRTFLFKLSPGGTAENTEDAILVFLPLKWTMSWVILSRPCGVCVIAEPNRTGAPGFPNLPRLAVGAYLGRKRWGVPGFPLRRTGRDRVCGFLWFFVKLPQRRHPERSASQIDRVTQRLWRGVEGPRGCYLTHARTGRARHGLSPGRRSQHLLAKMYP
jgi:hypothetical protein